MKQFTFLLIFITSIITVFSQKDKVCINEVYQNIESKTLVDKVIKCDSLTLEEIMQKFENFSGTAFVNYNNVTNAKTSNQIVINYVTSVSLVGWNLRVVARFKDGRFKVTVTDEGNIYVPPSRAGSITIPAMQERSVYLSTYFTAGDCIEYRVKPGPYNAKEKHAKHVKKIKEEAKDFVARLEQYMANNVSSDDDW
jgi:hypothetical protein